jgi:hypothetical protein
MTGCRVLVWPRQRLPASGPSFLASNPEADQGPEKKNWPEVVGNLAEAFGDDGELFEEGHCFDCFDHVRSLGPESGQGNGSLGLAPVGQARTASNDSCTDQSGDGNTQPHSQIQANQLEIPNERQSR